MTFIKTRIFLPSLLLLTTAGMFAQQSSPKSQAAPAKTAPAKKDAAPAQQAPADKAAAEQPKVGQEARPGRGLLSFLPGAHV